MSKSYNIEKLHTSVHALVTSELGLHERLINTWGKTLSQVKAESLPEGVKAKFDDLRKYMMEILDRVTKSALPADSVAQKVLDDGQVKALLHDIVTIYVAAEKDYGGPAAEG